jgi:hypothetical protein
MPRPTYLRADLVYFARCEGFVKVGFTQTPPARVAILNTASPWPVTLIGVMIGDETSEKAVHFELRRAGLHHRNEWFRFEGLAAEVAELLTDSPLYAYEAREAVNAFWQERLGSDHLTKLYAGRPDLNRQDALGLAAGRTRFLTRGAARKA